MMCKEAVNRAYESPLSEGLLFERRMFHALFGDRGPEGRDGGVPGEAQARVHGALNRDGRRPSGAQCVLAPASPATGERPVADRPVGVGQGARVEARPARVADAADGDRT